MSRICLSLLLAAPLAVAVAAAAESEATTTVFSMRNENEKAADGFNDPTTKKNEQQQQRSLLSLGELLPTGDEEPPPTSGGGNSIVNFTFSEEPQQEEEGEATEPATAEGETNNNNDNSEGADQSQQEQDPFALIPGYIQEPTSTSPPRDGDFEELNQLLGTAYFYLPDADVEDDIFFQKLRISMKNLDCSKVSFRNLELTKELKSNQEVFIGVEMVDLRIQCEFDFDWTYIFLSGNGHARVQVTESSARIGMNLFSPDYTQFPPNRGDLIECGTDINLGGLEFSGNIASAIFNVFEQLIIDQVHSMIDEKVCEDLRESGSDMLGDMLQMVADEINPYLSPVDDWRYNVSYPEMTMVIPEDAQLLSWNNDDGYGQFYDAVLDEMEFVLGTLREDEYAPDVSLSWPNGTEYPVGHDLGINVMLRSYLLDDDRSFVLDAANFEEMNASNVVMESHDLLTENAFMLKSLKIYGLDTITNFKPFTRYGNFTLQNALRWEYLSFQVETIMEIKASSLPEAYIRDPERADPWVEEISFQVGVEDINVVVSLMAALDPEQVKLLPLGSLLDLMSAVPCLTASLYDFSLAGLNISIGDIRTPTIQGLISPGLDRLIKEAIEVGFFMYKGTILQAIPSLFESTIRDLITEGMDEIVCPPLELPKKDAFVDLRDLLLDPIVSHEAGATGLAPYGDLASTIYGIGQSMWQEVLADGTLGLNELLIQPLTTAFSGQPGLLTIPGELYSFITTEDEQIEFKGLVNRFEFAMYDLRLDHIDTIVHPMALLQPLNHPFITQSTINMGPLKKRPLNVTMAMRMSLDIVDSPLSMDNVFDVGISVSSLELFFETLTMASRNNFLSFELGDGLDVSCWLSVMPAPDLDELGYRIEGSLDQGLELRRLLTSISDLKFHINCVKCANGIDSLPDMVDIFDRTGVTDVLSYRLPLFAEEIAISENIQVHFDRWLTDAPYYCEHRPEYDEEYKPPASWETPEFTQLSLEASDSLFFTAFSLVELPFVLLVETHAPWALDKLDPMAGQRNFTAPEGTNLFDWTNLSATVDGFADDLRSYVGDPMEDEVNGGEDLGVNIAIRDYFLDENGIVDFVQLLGGKPIEIVLAGVVILFHSIKVGGLDSFTRFDIGKPIAPQTVLNSMFMKHLDIELDMSTGSRTEPPQHIIMKTSMTDFNMTIPFFAAIDHNALEALELGHFLAGEHVLSCLLASAVMFISLKSWWRLEAFRCRLSKGSYLTQGKHCASRGLKSMRSTEKSF